MTMIVMAAALLGLLPHPAAAEPDALARIRGGGRLAVGVPVGPSPAAGFDREVFAAVGSGMGVAVDWVEVAPEAALPGLDAGRFDVAAGPFPVAEGVRPGRVALPPVASEGDALLKRRGDGTLLKTTDVAGKVVGLIGAGPGLARLRIATLALRGRLAARPATSRIAWAADARGDLVAGRVAAVAGTLPDVTAAALARPEAFEVVGPAFGSVTRLAPVARADPDHARLVDALRAGLAAMRSDGRLAILQRTWFGLAFDPPDAGPPQPVPVKTAKP